MLLTMTHQSTWLPLELSLHKGRGQEEEGLQAPDQPLAPGCQKRKQEEPVEAAIVGRWLRLGSGRARQIGPCCRGERLRRLLLNLGRLPGKVVNSYPAHM